MVLQSDDAVLQSYDVIVKSCFECFVESDELTIISQKVNSNLKDIYSCINANLKFKSNLSSQLAM